MTIARALWLPSALRAQGLDVVEQEGWRTRGKDELLAVPHGVMFHHTATPIGVPDSAPLNVVTYGRSDLPGPIANIMVGRSGTVWVIASGKANHAGLGGPWRTVPRDSGNGYTIGVEVVNNGIGERWSDTVLDACDGVFAAVLKQIDKDASWCVGHKEYTSRKIDPSLNMDEYRARLRAYMEGDMPDDRFTLFLEGIRARRAGQTKNADWDNVKKLGYEVYDDGIEFPKPTAHTHLDYAPATHTHEDDHDHKHVHGEAIPVP